MDELEEIFQRYVKSYFIEEKRIPVEISKKKAALARDKEEYQKAVDNNDKHLIHCYQEILKDDEYDLHAYEEKSSFLREPSKEDFLYRWKQREEFPQKVATYADENEMLCFHGTDIFGAKHIIKSGQISSGVDRLGHATSFDPRGRISVTNNDTVDTSVGQYMNLISNFLYPSGCLFVVTAKDKAEYNQLSSGGWMIENVDFRLNPDRLVAIITTPENKERINEWAQKSNIDTGKIMDFEGFIKRCKDRNPKYSQSKIQACEKSIEIE